MPYVAVVDLTRAGAPDGPPLRLRRESLTAVRQALGELAQRFGTCGAVRVGAVHVLEVDADDRVLREHDLDGRTPAADVPRPRAAASLTTLPTQRGAHALVP
ncbi:hypothetical protein [Cellulomonas oligotrophica]|uniref:Uncharacterized protein n=1 Tax=Cellulomonas oligotrophica TaxID=931536 RepID=A0A7Y9JXL0_9CELL|nr:hypothetical protein [Cellulomonas oligotrophica]NYD85772.1 hypothetical protein [Cellulomonas oligotrophica]GIG31222.1 hypothetical protein Col01nite_03810 [Cellulomonas oligotrophica]